MIALVEAFTRFRINYIKVSIIFTMMVEQIVSLSMFGCWIKQKKAASAETDATFANSLIFNTKSLLPRIQNTLNPHQSILHMVARQIILKAIL